MARSWKATERRTATFFNSTRTPLSGGNSGHTRSDTLSKYVFVESKSSKKSAIWTLFKKTRPLAKKEGKPCVLVTHLDHHEGFLITFHSGDLQEVIEAFQNCGVYDPGAASGEVAELPSLPPAPEPDPSSDVPRRQPLRRPLGRGGSGS